MKTNRCTHQDVCYNSIRIRADSGGTLKTRQETVTGIVLCLDHGGADTWSCRLPRHFRAAGTRGQTRSARNSRRGSAQQPSPARDIELQGGVRRTLAAGLSAQWASRPSSPSWPLSCGGVETTGLVSPQGRRWNDRKAGRSGPGWGVALGAVSGGARVLFWLRHCCRPH